MAESVSGAVLQQLTRSLEAVGSQLEAESVPRHALVEFKTAVDQIRLSAWALLEGPDTPGSVGQRSVIAQFRLARANELCKNLCDDLEAGLIPPGADALKELHTNVQDLVNLAGVYVG